MMTAAKAEEAAVVMRVVKEVEAPRNRGIGIVTTPLSSRRLPEHSIESSVVSKKK